MIGTLEWLDAIVYTATKQVYLWGGPSYKPPYTGDAGVPSRKFEFELLSAPPVPEEPFFFELDGNNKKFRMGIAKDAGSMYACGGHLYPMTKKPKYRIVKWLPVEK